MVTTPAQAAGQAGGDAIDRGWAGNVADNQLPGTFEIDWVRVDR